MGVRGSERENIVRASWGSDATFVILKGSNDTTTPTRRPYGQARAVRVQKNFLFFFLIFYTSTKGRKEMFKW